MIFALAGEAGAPTGAGPVEASRDSLPFCRALERFPGSLRARNSAQSWRQCPRDSPDCHPTEGHRRTRACRFRPTPRHNLPARCQPKDPARIHGQSGLVSTCRSGSGLHRELWAREAWCFGSYGSVGSWLPEPVIPEDTPNPRENVQQAESLSIAFLVILETLSPTSEPSIRSRRSSATNSEKLLAWCRKASRTAANSSAACAGASMNAARVSSPRRLGAVLRGGHRPPPRRSRRLC